MIVTIIILNYNSSKDIIEAVGSVEESAVPKGFERKIVVVENSNKPLEWENIQVLKKFKDVELLKTEKNLGFTGGNNLAIKNHPESDFYLLLNPDTKVSKDFLVNLVGATRGSPVLASPKIYFYPGFEFHKDRYEKKDLGKVIWYGGGKLDWDNVVGSHVDVDKIDVGARSSRPENGSENPTPTDFCTGCCLLISKEVVSKIGLLDDKLFFSWEDVDYSIRAKKAGFDVSYVPSSIIWHKNANTSGGAGSPIQDFYQTRNRLIIAFKYARWKVKFLLLWQLLRKANLNRLKAIFSACFS